MAKIDIVAEMLARHNDTEVIDHLYAVLRGVTSNYKTAIDTNTPEVLFGNLGDLVLATEILKGMKKRNDDRLAQTEQ